LGTNAIIINTLWGRAKREGIFRKFLKIYKISPCKSVEGGKRREKPYTRGNRGAQYLGGGRKTNDRKESDGNGCFLKGEERKKK